MAFFTSNDFKQFGANILKTDANAIALVKGVVKADSYATAISKIVASTTFAAADVSFAANGQDLRATFVAKSGVAVTAAAIITDDLSVMVYSTTSQKIHLCQDVTDRAITNGAGDKVDIPAFTYDIKDPVAA
ncbi:MAG TPA: hypothetical protein DCS87_11585 [Rheinheimera sp.]|nr:hypothetical protein [Rheinheimera sp.]